MPIRQATVTDPAPSPRAAALDRVVIRDDNTVVAHWTIAMKDGTRSQVNVQISATLQAALATRAAFQTFLDNVRDDTFPRTGA